MDLLGVLSHDGSASVDFDLSKERFRMRILPAIVLITFLLSGITHYGLYKSEKREGSFFTQLLYLPQGKYLKRAAFGYQNVLADFIYLWSIQYYGDPQFSPKTKYLKHTYNIVTDLDPYFLDAYQTGALFMFYEGRNPSAGLELLKKGMVKNPNAWILPTDAGFYCMLNLKDNGRAATFFEAASNIPSAPTLVKRMLAGTRFRMGDKKHAYHIWKEVYEQAENGSIKQTAFQHMHDLKTLIDLEDLNRAIDAYHSKNGEYPSNLQKLVASGFIPAIPLDPEGNPYVYDSKIGEVSYAQQLNIYKRYQ
jgi:hypothetical protein